MEEEGYEGEMQAVIILQVDDLPFVPRMLNHFCIQRVELITLEDGSTQEVFTLEKFDLVVPLLHPMICGLVGWGLHRGYRH